MHECKYLLILFSRVKILFQGNLWHKFLSFGLSLQKRLKFKGFFDCAIFFIFNCTNIKGKLDLICSQSIKIELNLISLTIAF